PDNHLLKISLVSGKIVFLRDGRMTELSSKELIHQTIHATSPDPFPHWTLKEIFEQPEAAFRALNQGGRLFGKNEVRLGGLNSHTDRLMSIKHLTLIASGTSRHAALIGQKFFQMLGGFDW